MSGDDLGQLREGDRGGHAPNRGPRGPDQVLLDLGLGYHSLGRRPSPLSPGEAQRLRITIAVLNGRYIAPNFGPNVTCVTFGSLRRGRGV